MRALLASFAISLAGQASAQAVDLAAIVETHIVPGYQALADETQRLSNAASAGCSAVEPYIAPELFDAYNAAFDAWVAVSHLRFGPSEVDDRAFALAFWPDPRGSTPKTLATMVRARDEAVNDPDAFAQVSVAARGVYAMEFLLYDDQFSAPQDAAYRCSLVQAVALDIASNAAAILAGWQDGYAALMTQPGNDTYRSDTEAARQLFTALITGLEFTETQRLGRPLGTFERPRPKRAEARRSGRSLRNVVLSLEATQPLATLLSGGSADVAQDYARALDRAAELDDPVLAGVADPGARFRVEALQSSVTTIRRTLLEDVGPSLGVTAGFNSLDGD